MRRTTVDLIRRHLPVSPVPSIPEIRLHLAGPHSGLGRLLGGATGGAPPYWAHLWAGGLVLARYLLDHPAVVAGRRVLDLGCGSGLVAIAAALGGARAVTATDIDAHAVAAATLNATLNGVTLAVTHADLLEGPAPYVDLVLVGDVFYEAALARKVMPWLQGCAEAGVGVLIGDPGRAPLPRHRLQPVHTGMTRDFGAGGTAVASTVYAIRGL